MTTAIDPTAIDTVLRDAVASGAVPHVAAIAADRDGVIYQGAAGPRAVGESDPVTVDTLFRIMSMTKMPCTVVALQQAEQGTLDLDAPVAEYCPQFASVQVMTGIEGDTPVLRPPASQATVRQLITHTSGLGYWFWSDRLVRWESITGTPNIVAGSAASFTAPMLADPGTQFIYGINLDWLGQVIEAVTGTGLDVAIKEGVTGPLGMDQTTFLMNDEQRPNSTPVHIKGEDGTWISIGEVLSQSPDYWAGGHGLYGPPSDYIKFERALLRGGELDGTRILRQATVDAAFRNQIGELDFPAEIDSADPASSHDFRIGPGFKWGYGLLLNTADAPGMRRAWSGSWAGLCNTHFWVDPAAGICASIYSNFLPFAPPQALALYNDFERALYAAL
ncbi:MAG TPA: serine hydrolase domain-containing protein [Streptosporangiaceae bacterium]